MLATGTTVISSDSRKPNESHYTSIAYKRQAEPSLDTNYQRQILSSIAVMSNRLGHESIGELRTWAFRTKAAAVSELVVRGWATANGIRANGTVGINIGGKPRLHVPLHLLEPEARASIREDIRSIRVTAPLSECVDIAEPDSISVTSRK
jgi:hypothetical protein